MLEGEELKKALSKAISEDSNYGCWSNKGARKFARKHGLKTPQEEGLTIRQFVAKHSTILKTMTADELRAFAMAFGLRTPSRFRLFRMRLLGDHGVDYSLLRWGQPAYKQLRLQRDPEKFIAEHIDEIRKMSPEEREDFLLRHRLTDSFQRQAVTKRILLPYHIKI